jgi:amidase
MIRHDALEISAALEKGDISAAELMQATLERIAAVNADVNAIVSLRDADTLMAEARAHDAAPRKGWLHGMPIAIKELVDVEGLPTTLGSPLFRDNIAAKDDIMVARLRAAGAIVIGKTNAPEFGLGSHTFNPVYGATRNPYDLSKSCGGSSGGAAVALATGMTAVADGSDMMGSLRNPAAWNNVYGMRPTWGVVPSSSKGDVFMDQLATLGPMGRSPADMAALLDTMKGRTSSYPHAVDLPDILPQIGGANAAPRIGWLGNWDGGLAYEAGITEISVAALAQMSDLGWQVEEVAAPFSLQAMWQAWIDLRSFAHGQRLQPHNQDPEKRKHLKEPARWEYERYAALSADQIYKASLIRSDWFRTATAVFDTYDALVLPSAQVWPFAMDIPYPTDIAGTSMDTYHRWMEVVVPAALIGLPVVNLPIGFGTAGLPAGLQLIGRQGADASLLQLAQVWHQATLWPQTRPAMP